MNGIRFNFPDATLPIVIVWYKNSNLAQEVGRSAPFAPSTTGHTLAPPNLEPLGYTFFFWETPDGGATLQTLRAKWAIDGSALLRTAFVLYTYVVGRGMSDNVRIGMTYQLVWADPAPYDTLLTDTRIVGEEIVVFSRGVGPLRPDEWVFTSEGIQLTTPGQSFEDGDTISILVSKSTQAPASATSGDSYKRIDADELLDSSYFGANCVAAFDNTVTKIHTTTFPSFATIPEGTQLEFSTYANPGLRYWVLQFAGSDTIPFMGQNRGRIILGVNERIKLWFSAESGTLIGYVTKYDGNYSLVGEVVFSDKRVLPGAVLAEGAEYDTADLLRLYEELNYGLPERIISSTPTLTKYNEFVDKRIGQQYDLNGTIPLVGTGMLIRYYPNRGKFIVSTSAGKIRVPDERGQSFRVLKDFAGNADSERMTQGAGGRQAQELLKHDHTVRHGRGGGIDTNPNGGAWIAVNNSPINDPYVLPAGGTEQRVDNTGKYAQIYI